MPMYYLEAAVEFRENYERRVNEAASHIKHFLKGNKPVFGIALGSGLGDIANSITNQTKLPYEQIPNFPKTEILGHIGDVILGELEGVNIIALKGRKHFYEEGNELFNTGILRTVLPIHTLANLGVKNYFVTNAAGGLNPSYKAGDLMIIKSHINMMPNPLLGREYNFKRVDNGERAVRFQPMHDAYNSNLREILKKSSSNYSQNVHEGVYLALTGPSFETEAECIAFRDGFKADAIGMSTAPEVIIARNRGMNVVGLSCITNVIDNEGRNITSHEEVTKILESQEIKDRLSTTVKNFFKEYKETLK
jgi:purine-nucleoside phosphorylase